MSAVWDLPLPTTEKMVLLVIADHAADDGTNSWPSIATIARKASISERQAQRVVSSLAEKGLIAVEPQAGGTRDTRADRRTNRYTVLADGVTRMSSRPSHGVTSATPRGDIRSAHGVTPMSPEPSLEPSTTEPPHLPAVTGGTISTLPGTITAQTIVQAFVDEFREVHGATPPTQTLARIGRDARFTLEREEYPPDVILAAAREAARFGHANLPSAITAVLSEGTRTRRRGPATAEDRIASLIPLIGGQS